MSDLIRRQDAINAVIWSADEYGEWARESIEKVPSAQAWITTSEQLPEYGESVLCYYEDDDYGVNHIIDDENGEWFIDGVVAWMPIEPYREE